MHAVFFRLKRSYQAPLRQLNKWLEVHGLTCARFDLLLFPGVGPGNMQSKLVKAAGVCPSVVSRRLKALEELRLVRRFKPDGDKRQRWVVLTDLGYEVFGRAHGDYWLGQRVDLAMETA